MKIDVENRIWVLDLIRCLAIVLVVFTHSHELANIQNVGLKSFFYSFDRLGVPLFFMLTGALVIPKLAKQAEINLVLFRKVVKFLFLLIFYSILTNSIFLFLFEQKSLLIAISDSILKYNGLYPSDNGAAIHLWFMYSIIGIYLVLPFVAKMLTNLSNRGLLWFILINIFILYIPFLLKKDGLVLFDKIGNDFLGSYLVYVLLGYWLIAKKGYRHISPVNSLLLLLIPIILLFIYEVYTGKFSIHLHWYSTSLFIVISTIGLLCLILNTVQKNPRSQLLTKLVSLISYASFGIYLSHLFLMYLIKSTVELPYPLLNTMIYFSGAFLLSFVLVYLLKKSKIGNFFVS